MTNPTSDFRAFELAGWSDHDTADTYLDSFGLVTSQSVPALIDAADIQPGWLVLDVATGPGYVAAAAATKGAIVTGIDFSPAMVQIARRKYPGITFQEGDAQQLAFPTSNFDSVIAAYGLLHFSDPDLAVREAFRVLHRGSRFAFSVWADPNSGSGMGFVLAAVQAHGRTDVPLPPGPPQFRFSDPAECERVLGAAGFIGIETQRVEQTWRAPNARAWLDGVRGGSVRLKALLAAQTPEAIEAIYGAVEETVRPYETAEGVAVPMPALVGWGRKP
jgi:SAM-dependent methyltransferase